MSATGRLTPGLSFAIAAIVPLRDLAEKDIGQHGAGEFELADTFDVVHGHDRPENCREMQNLAGCRLQLLWSHGAVGGAEEHGLRRYLADAAARPYRLIVDLHVLVQLAVLREPLRIDRIRERGTRTVDMDILLGDDDAGGHGYRGRQESERLSRHHEDPPPDLRSSRVRGQRSCVDRAATA